MRKSVLPRQHAITSIAVLGAFGVVMGLTPHSAQAQMNQPGNNGGGQSTTSTPPRPASNPNLQVPLVTVPADFGSMKLAPGFLLNIQVYGESDLSGPVRVDNDGNLRIPFLKPVHVQGDTVAMVTQKIEQAFKDQGILKNPQVSVDVQQFASTSVTVVGEVQSPGKIELLAPHSLQDVISLAGGLTPLAGTDVQLKRADPKADQATLTFHLGKAGDGAGMRDTMVYPGDTVVVERAGIVYVLGGVNRPGGYAMQEGGQLNVAEAISLAQGLALQAKVGALRVVQHGPDGQLIDVPISYNKIMDGKEKPLQLAAGDIVYVPISKVKSVLGATTSLIGQTTAATIYTVK